MYFYVYKYFLPLISHTDALFMYFVSNKVSLHICMTLNVFVTVSLFGFILFGIKKQHSVPCSHLTLGLGLGEGLVMICMGGSTDCQNCRHKCIQKRVVGCSKYHKM